MRRRKNGTYACVLCYWLPFLFPSIVACPKTAAATEGGTRKECRFVQGHRGACRPVERDPPMENPTRDGMYDILTGKSHDPTWERRSRVGPHR